MTKRHFTLLILFLLISAFPGFSQETILTNVHIISMENDQLMKNQAALKLSISRKQHWNPSRNAQDALIIRFSNMPALFRKRGAEVAQPPVLL